MILRTKSWILLCGAASTLFAACSPKPAESDTGVADANVGDLPMDVVIPPKDSQQDTPAAPETSVGDEIGDAAEAFADADTAKIVDVVIPPDELADAPEGVSDASDAADAAEVVDVIIAPDLLPDAIADTGEIDEMADSDAAQLDPSEVADSTDAQKDTFLSMPDLGPCVSKDLTLYADSLSDDGTCTSACAPDHPCICGDCAWVQTPPLVQPRWGASAVWTGTEIVMVGGWPGVFPQYPITAERWNPKSGKGWEMINTPVTKSIHRDVEAHWDGTYVWAIVEAPDPQYEKEEYSFRWDPLTNTSVKLAMKNRLFAATTSPGDWMRAWVNGQIFEIGTVVTGKTAGMYAFSLYSTADDAWQPIAFPDKLVTNNWLPLNPVPCVIPSGDDIFIYDQWLTPAPGSGLVKKPITLRYNVTNQVWSAISQAFPVATITHPCGGGGFAIGTETGFVLWGEKVEPSAKNPAQGAIYNKQTDTWAVMAKGVPEAYAINTHRQSALVGDGIYVFGQYFFDNVNTPAQKGWKANTVAQFHIDSNSWSFTTPIGFPTDSRSETGFVVADNELYLIGGIDGPPDANIIHKDGVRLALPGSNP